MNRMKIFGLTAAAFIAAVPVTSASAHEFYHHHHDGGPIFGLVRAAVGIATLPVRVAGGVVSAVTYYPAPRPYYAQPVYYAAPQPVYYAPQPVYGYPPQAYYGQ